MIKIDEGSIQIKGNLKENLAEIMTALQIALDIFGKETFYKMIQDTYDHKVKEDTICLMIEKMKEFKEE